MIYCGTCADGKACKNNKCESCTPKTCNDLGFECGVSSDQCDGMLNCGYCAGDNETCQDGSCTTKLDCKGYAECVSQCNDTSCDNTCKSKASQSALTDYTALKECVINNQCADAQGNVDPDCVLNKCYDQYVGCFNGDTYLSCFDLMACLYNCKENDSECVVDCYSSSVETAHKDLSSLLDCVDKVCGKTCDCNEGDETCKTKCHNCLSQAQGEGGKCYAPLMQCIEDEPYNNKTCKDIHDCVANCTKDQPNCAYKCVYMGSKDAQKKYIDYHNCIVDNCGDVCNCQPDDTQCLNKCETCLNDVLGDNGRCKALYDACIPPTN